MASWVCGDLRAAKDQATGRPADGFLLATLHHGGIELGQFVARRGETGPGWIFHSRACHTRGDVLRRACDRFLDGFTADCFADLFQRACQAFLHGF